MISATAPTVPFAYGTIQPTRDAAWQWAQDRFRQLSAAKRAGRVAFFDVRYDPLGRCGMVMISVTPTIAPIDLEDTKPVAG